MKKFIIASSAVAVLSLSLIAGVAFATHSWGSYHWARTLNPFTLKLGDNVSSAWDPYLATTSSDWSQSSVLDTTVVPGSFRGNCKPTAGRVETCSKSYGFNGWLGVASIWINGAGHITQGTVKVNDTYFNTSTYNTPAWRNLVMCQEVGHTLGLNHQDETFGNPNLGTCMDYTSDPSTNQHPNEHDYEQLGTIYGHLDSITTIGQTIFNKENRNDATDAENLGKEIKKNSKGKTSLYELDLGKGEKLFTFVFWAE